MLIGYYGARNLGDELMLDCLHKWLENQGFEITVVAEDAAVVRTLHGVAAIQNYPLLGQSAPVEALLRGKALGVAKKIAASSRVFAGGGDMIRDEIGWRTFSYQIEKLIFAALLGKPIYLVNVGITKPVTRYGKAILRRLLPRCQKIIVREERSLQICREFGAGAVTVLAPDIVLRLPDLFPVQCEPPDRPYVLVALHENPNIYRRYEMNETRMDNFAQALDALLEAHDCDVWFLACQSGEHADDHRMHRRIISRLVNADRARLLDWTVEPREVSRYFLQSSAIVAMRLHAAVLAAAFGKSCVLLPYDHKVDEFGRQAGMRHVLTAENLDDTATINRVFENALAEEAVPFKGPIGGADWLALKIE